MAKIVQGKVKRYAYVELVAASSKQVQQIEKVPCHISVWKGRKPICMDEGKWETTGTGLSFDVRKDNLLGYISANPDLVEFLGGQEELQELIDTASWSSIFR